MLRLKEIKKTYVVADLRVEALKGINLAFRKNEFVSILGPSGCGKTTLLNIIGGLDKYTSGDLIINGKSTKSFKDADWDTYRNHKIGFVFQSYNLIPHQTILSNVELALTIAGISKEERIKRAKEALDKVGLKGLYKKKPGQLSGGQCQRVAIARSLVNEPDILLADEPTGALDSETSVQIMDLMAEIAKNKLVIMVTHNPELAEKYSTRIVRLLDGNVIEDTNPFSEEAEIKEVETSAANPQEPTRKAKMSWWTSFKLSARNLLSKTKRTILVCFAGSIGIVGISSVLGVSAGVTGYIDSMQDDMLSGNPITISETSYNISALMNTMSTSEKFQVAMKEGFVNVDSLLQYFAQMVEGEEAFVINNEINEDYINYLKAMPDEYYQAINFDLGINMGLNIYTDFTNSKNITEEMSLSAIQESYIKSLSESEFKDFTSILSGLTAPLSQMIPNEEYILSQYDVKEGRIASAEDEIMIVVDHKNRLTDLTLAQLGYYRQQEFYDLAIHASEPSLDDKWRFSYDELMAKEFYYYPNDVVYKENKNPITKFKNPFTYQPYSKYFDESQGMKLKVVGILEPKEDIVYGSLTSGFYYTQDLSEKMLEDAKDSRVITFPKEVQELVGDAIEFDVDDFRYGMMVELPGDAKPENYFEIDYKLSYVDYGGNLHEDDSDILRSIGSLSFNFMLPDTGTNIELYGPSLREMAGKALPNSMEIYPNSFEEKHLVTDYLDKWNSDEDIVLNGQTLTPEMRYNITYVDNLEVVINMINSLINMVTVALICFTALSLVVSCVMIAIITYVSVMERYKEIGVIRALGGRKRDVSNLFNAETIIIGALAGLFGIVVTYVLGMIVNIIILNMFDIYPISALPLYQAGIMLLVSVLLTVISGFIPARSAAKKDPAVALRTE